MGEVIILKVTGLDWMGFEKSSGGVTQALTYSLSLYVANHEWLGFS